MCLLVLKGKNRRLLEDCVREAYSSNKDGAGVMAILDGQFVVEKTQSVEELIALLPKYDKVDAVVHFRWGTSGKKDLDNVHPFKVTENLWMAHNGVFSIAQPNKDFSDTWHFAKMLSEIPNIDCIVESQSLQEIVGAAIGKGNKLIFLRTDGVHCIINEEQGHWNSECWFSNHSYELSKTFWKKKPKEKCSCGIVLRSDLEKSLGECEMCMRIYS